MCMYGTEEECEKSKELINVSDHVCSYVLISHI